MSPYKKNNKQKTSRIFARCSLLISLIFFSVVSARADIAQIPLFLTSSVDPNIMFVLDDSGSMQFEHMPDETKSLANYLFPPPSSLYGGSLYTQYVPSFDDGNLLNFFSRSSANNSVFYNPLIEYTPWVDGNNEAWPLSGDGNAEPDSAPYNPADLSRGSLDLTSQQTQAAYWITNPYNDISEAWWECNGWCNYTFWPITFYQYKGSGGNTDPDNYVKYQIRGDSGFRKDLDGGAETSVTNFTWTDGDATITRTVAEEAQNFANWFTFYRSRILSARAGIGKGFAEQGEALRVGFGTINTSDTVVSGVKPFEGEDRDNFFNLLYNQTIPAAGTPLRKSLDAVGQYFSRTDDEGPWSSTPGESGGEDYECRNSYTILMTDGYWSGGSSYDADTYAARQNVDGSNGPSISNPSGSDFQYEPVDPYQDDYSNTLADVAMYYWNRDLRTDLGNRVPVSSKNEAFWQHMVTFGVGLGVSGSVSESDAWSAVEDGTAIDWPYTNPSESNCSGGECPARLDDLLHAAVNSRGGFFSAQNPKTFAEELSATLSDIVGRTESSAAAIATNSTRLVDGSLIYQARFDSRDWSGEIRAYPIQIDGTVIYDQEQWSSYYSERYPSSETVPPYPGWSTSDSGKIPDHGTRSVFTYNPDVSDGLEFDVNYWDNLSISQQDALIDGNMDGAEPDVDKGKARLNWIRGQEIEGMRERDTILGDVVNSDPLIVDVPNFEYGKLPEDTAGRDTGRDTYATYRKNSQDRRRVLYVGGNDGMLHAFDASTITPDSTEGGKELFAYVPAGVYENLASLTDPEYEHRYFVDGSPIVGDAYVEIADVTGDEVDDLAWRTILIGTLGAGGRSIFALDVTDPDNFDASDVLWEFSHPDLGYTMGKPGLVRMQDNSWAVVFGNGYGSDNHRAQLFIVDVEDGSLITLIDTETGDADSPNGLSEVALLPDSERTTVAAYAGDLLGNIWKFDLSSTNTGQWDVAYKQGNTPVPLFSAENESGQSQPVTAPIEIGNPPEDETDSEDETDYMVYFGTGKYFEAGDNDVTNPAIQSFYGIWDNGSEITADRDAVLVEQVIEEEGTVSTDVDGSLTAGPLAPGVLDEDEYNYRIVTDNTVDYSSSRGWYLDLVSPELGIQGERVVAAPLLRHGRVVFTTLIPIDDPCSTGGTSWLMELDALSGARLTEAVFDLNGDGRVDSADLITATTEEGEEVKIPASGRQSKVGIIKTPAVISGGGTGLEYKYFGGSDGDIEVVTEAGGSKDIFGRRSWRQLQ
jgi:type IV pilus assembly protein PilY1